MPVSARHYAPLLYFLTVTFSLFHKLIHIKSKLINHKKSINNINLYAEYIKKYGKFTTNKIAEFHKQNSAI
ncbi:hypothetical protein BGI15_05260 [Snodgrassella alvi]|nr:hypothetical protein BGI07_09730 [Snodgrassella alvi]ORF29374.1 hypothetical protein BGI10_10500 [Snodgrassella alvi]ORF33586.1 hypothetical protein BGI11_08000 [Snodgrassella alvi]ORF37945.1 hypothetical protein BGI13_06780 [Snodgrassella alvi]ORF38168.1 hypothetical protein BGI14_09615 [Snodgrassella alvi]